MGTRGRKLILRFGAPLDDSEFGGGNQYRLKVAYRKNSSPLNKSVVFRSYFGETASCNQLALHKELVRREADIDLLWVVKDSTVAVPAGGSPLVIGTQDYYEALATTTFYVDNMHQPDFMSKRTGQIFVETFHGYPAKSMGLRHWENLRLDKEQVDSLLKRAGDWTFLLSPATYASDPLCEAFGFRGEVIESGYPRNDRLTHENTLIRKKEIREQLGIPSNNKVALFAPTFRDRDAVGDFKSKMVDHLDVTKLMEMLPSDWTILIRGHAFHARHGVSVAENVSIINVTDYPDVNDLMLSSDVGIFDYSSIRFDYSILDKPMIFMVPDKDDYLSFRDPVVSFADTSPGIHVETTAGVAQALLDAEATNFNVDEKHFAFKRKYVDLDCGESSRAVVDRIFGA